MKKWLILAYIISVLAISGMAKAANSSVVISSYEYNDSLLSLTVSGNVVGDCGTNISSVIIDSQATEELPVLMIELGNNSQTCISTSNASNRFDLTLDLRSLGIKSGTSYFVMFNNLFKNNDDPTFMLTIPKEISHNIPKTEQIKGILKQDENYNFYLDVNGSLYFVKSVFNLENYLNNKVIIDALKLIYQVGPGFDINSHRPLREDTSNQPIDYVYILGISAI